MRRGVAGEGKKERRNELHDEKAVASGGVGDDVVGVRAHASATDEFQTGRCFDHSTSNFRGTSNDGDVHFLDEDERSIKMRDNANVAYLDALNQLLERLFC